ncbi:MAG: 4-hydroxy-tetrahydrodipicolinate synthase [Chitinophagaceae bacterium]|nr:4-hydroxy-tetrahydrodipicolinate synthase [Chitinophagaceae bacterium]
MSLKEKFKGTGIAIVTPFDENREIDWPAFEQLIEYWIQGNADYLVVLGTTGESATIHGKDKQAVFSFVCDKVKGRLPLMAGIGGNDTKEVTASLREFNLTGYDAILSVSPYYNKPNQEGIFRHYQAISEASPLPVMIYNVPGRTGMNVSAETQLRIAHECKNVFATKEASGNFEQINQILKYKPESFMVVSGDDPITLPMMALGADGVISVVANAFPSRFSEMVRLCLKGNFSEAARIHFQFTDIITTLFAEGSPAGIKAYLSEMGLCKKYCRLPVWEVSDSLLRKIKSLLKEYQNAELNAAN